MTNVRPLRILHTPTAIGGNPPGLARAERRLGLDSQSIVLQPSPFKYSTDGVLLRSGEHEILLELRRWNLLWKAMREYDVIHFNFGRTIMPVPIFGTSPALRKYPRIIQQVYNIYAGLLALRDLPILKRLGKGIVVTFQGDDIRQGDFCRTHFDITAAKGEVEPWYYTDRSDAYKRWMTKQYAKYADRIYALNPDLLYVLPERAEFMAYASVFPEEWESNPPRIESSDVPTVLHAPSNRGFKGTKHVLEAVQRLQEEDQLNFKFILVEGLSHEEAKNLYKGADLLIDQVLAGWYGALAVELMALGKPVMCYIRNDDLRFIPQEMGQDLPIINVNPRTLYECLKDWLIHKRSKFSDVGLAGRAYAEKWHNPLDIASKLKSVYHEITKR